MPSGSRTLYINNLNERVPQKYLRKELEKLCAEFGAIAIYTGRGLRKRGQAFVAFQTEEDASRALDGLQHQILLRKPLRVALSRSPSDIHLGPEELSSRKRERLAKEIPTTQSKLEVADSKFRDAETEVSSAPEAFGEPHNVVLVQRIPVTLVAADLEAKCKDFPGFVEARMFAVKHVGFLEFESVAAAEAAIESLSTMGIGNVTFAKK